MRALCIAVSVLLQIASARALECKGEDPCKACRDCSKCALCDPKNPKRGSCGTCRDQSGEQARKRDAKRRI